MAPGSDWQKCDTDKFWGEIAPWDHVIQIYESDTIFIDSLAGFVGGGINAGDCVIVIAVKSHLAALEKRLKSFGISVSTLIADDRYVPLSAEETLSKFMVGDRPDEDLFNAVVSKLLERGKRMNRKVRAFGEMVAFLWAQGKAAATVNLEHLWNKFCAKNPFSLFCAYPKSGFTRDINESIANICNCHTKMISGSEASLTQVVYRNSN